MTIYVIVYSLCPSRSRTEYNLSILAYSHIYKCTLPVIFVCHAVSILPVFKKSVQLSMVPIDKHNVILILAL